MKNHKYAEMFPADFDRELKKTPIAYLSCGGLEVHGAHNALGLDGYLGYDIALAAAEISGGVVLPPLFMAAPGGWPRTMKWQTLRGMGNAALGRPSIWHGRDLLVRVVEQTLWNLAQIGFKVCMLVPGHAPNYNVLADYCRRIKNRKGRMAVEAVNVLSYEYSPPLSASDSGHGGVWESSVLKYFHPELVAPERLRSENGDMRRLHAPIAHPAEIRADAGAAWVALASRRIAGKALAMLAAGKPVPRTFPGYIAAFRVSRARQFKGDLASLPPPSDQQIRNFKVIAFQDARCVAPAFKGRGSRQPRVVFYACRLVCRDAARLRLGLCYDAPIKVWVDGNVRLLDPLGTFPASGPAGGDKKSIPLDLRRGRHDLLIALASHPRFATCIRARLELNPPAAAARRRRLPDMDANNWD